MARMPAFDRAISVVLTGAKDKVQKALVGIVHDELDRVKRESNPSGYDQAIDGVQGKAIEQIEPFGNAVFHFHYGRQVVEFALEMLRSLSPVDSGDYRGGHHVYVDGSMVSDLSAVETAQRIVIANTLPYARRIELPAKWRHGPNKGQVRGWSLQSQVPQPADSVYRHAAATCNRRYGNIMRAEYAWVGLDGGGAEVGGAAGNKSANRYPAILFEDRRLG